VNNENDVNNNLKRIIPIIFLLIFLPGTIFSTIYLVDSLKVTTNKVVKIIDQIKNNNQKQSENAKFDVPWYVIDYSSITPIILLILCVTVSWNSLIGALGKYKSETYLVERIDYFPLHSNYENFWIQLGFLGTLIGFMIIGFEMKNVFLDFNINENEISKAAKISLSIQIQAFGTALISTFTAVFLAFVIAPMIKFIWVFNYSLKDKTELDDFSNKLNEISSIIGDAFKNALINSSETLEKVFIKEIELFDERNQLWSDTLKKRDTILSTIEKQTNEVIKNTTNNINKLNTFIDDALINTTNAIKEFTSELTNFSENKIVESLDITNEYLKSNEQSNKLILNELYEIKNNNNINDKSMITTLENIDKSFDNNNDLLSNTINNNIIDINKSVIEFNNNLSGIKTEIKTEIKTHNESISVCLNKNFKNIITILEIIKSSNEKNQIVGLNDNINNIKEQIINVYELIKAYANNKNLNNQAVQELKKLNIEVNKMNKTFESTGKNQTDKMVNILKKLFYEFEVRVDKIIKKGK